MLQVQCQNYFEALKIEAPFPSSPEPAASVNADFDRDITEFTVCLRMLVESYNDGCITIVHANLAGKKLQAWDERHYKNTLCKDIGWTLDGYQEQGIYLMRNIPGGGLDKQAFPIWHNLNVPKNVRPSEWHSFCTSYSSTSHKFHQYQDGVKVFNYTFMDPVEDPLSSDTFKNLLIGGNMRGLITDLNIYSFYFEKDAMVDWTRGCAQKKGDIFAWDTRNLNITQEKTNTKNVTIVSIDKKEICIDPNKKIEPQMPDLSGKKSTGNHFKPKPPKKSLTDSVLELITDPLNTKTAFQARDLCYRLNGELLPRPQTKEEETLMDKVLWDFMMTKTMNNLTFINENHKVADIWAGGISYVSEEESSKDLSIFGSREHIFPESGHFQLFHSSTGEPLEEVGVQIPSHDTSLRGRQQCPVCFPHMKEPISGHNWLDRTEPWCHYVNCNQERLISAICVFPDVPTFKIRGLCRSAAMDKEYQITKHKPMDLAADVGHWEWGLDSTRSYLGPKGWVISINKTDKSWRISHYHYTDLTLTMVDTDTLPFGRHKWLIENNVCTEGKTSTQVLQISGCNDGQFTCDDGKCLDISQRCNNIEVRYIREM